MVDNDNKNIVEPEILNEEPEVCGIESRQLSVMEDSSKLPMSVIIDRVCRMFVTD